MQPLFLYGKRDLNKKAGITFIISTAQAFHGDHGSIRGIMQTAELIFLCFPNDHFHQFVKWGIYLNIYRDQAAFFFLYQADLG